MTSLNCFEGQVSGLYWTSVESAAMILLSTWTFFHLYCQQNEIDCRIKFWSTTTIIFMCFSCVAKSLADGYCITSDPDDGISYSLRNTATAHLLCLSQQFKTATHTIHLYSQYHKR